MEKTCWYPMPHLASKGLMIWPLRPTLPQPGVTSVSLDSMDASPLQVITNIFPRFYLTVHHYTFIHLGEKRHYKSKVSCPRTHHNDQGQGSNTEPSIERPTHWPLRLLRFTGGCDLWQNKVYWITLDQNIHGSLSALDTSITLEFQFLYVCQC